MFSGHGSESQKQWNTLLSVIGGGAAAEQATTLPRSISSNRSRRSSLPYRLNHLQAVRVDTPKASAASETLQPSRDALHQEPSTCWAALGILVDAYRGPPSECCGRPKSLAEEA